MIRRTPTPKLVSPESRRPSSRSSGLRRPFGTLVLIGLVCLASACGAGESDSPATDGAGTEAGETGRTERREPVSQPGAERDSGAEPEVRAEPGPGAEPGP